MKKLRISKLCDFPEMHNKLIDRWKKEELPEDKMFKELIAAHKLYKKNGGDFLEFAYALNQLQAYITFIARIYGAPGKQKSDKYTYM